MRKVWLYSPYLGHQPLIEALAEALSVLGCENSEMVLWPGLVPSWQDDFDPGKDDIVVTTHNWIGERYQSKCYRLVNIDHSIGIVKNYKRNVGDYCVVPSAFIEQQFRDYGAIPRYDFWRSGFIQTDAVVRALQEIKTDGKTVVICPTWNDANYGSESIWRDLIMRLLKDGWHVVAKFHPLMSTTTGLIRWCERLLDSGNALTVPRIEENIASWIARGDYFISDMSGVIPLSMISGRPVLAYNSFRWWTDNEFIHEDFHHTLRSCLYQFSSPLDAVDRLQRLADGYDPLESERAMMVDRVFGSTLDGAVSTRIAQKIMDLQKE